MSTAYIVVTVVAALLVGYSAAAVAFHARWVVENLADYKVRRPWWPWLALAKTAGAAGLLVGLLVPAVGIAAGAGLIGYFLGAVATVLHARRLSHVVYPLLFLAPVIASAALRVAS